MIRPIKWSPTAGDLQRWMLGYVVQQANKIPYVDQVATNRIEGPYQRLVAILKQHFKRDES